MKLSVTIEKKYAILIVGLLLVLAAFAGVVAFGTNDPETFGHSRGELAIDLGCRSVTVQAVDEAIARCADDEYLTSCRTQHVTGTVECVQLQEGPRGPGPANGAVCAGSCGGGEVWVAHAFCCKIGS